MNAFNFINCYRLDIPALGCAWEAENVWLLWKNEWTYRSNTLRVLFSTIKFTIVFFSFNAKKKTTAQWLSGKKSFTHVLTGQLPLHPCVCTGGHQTYQSQQFGFRGFPWENMLWDYKKPFFPQVLGTWLRRKVLVSWRLQNLYTFTFRHSIWLEFMHLVLCTYKNTDIKYEFLLGTKHIQYIQLTSTFYTVLRYFWIKHVWTALLTGQMHLKNIHRLFLLFSHNPKMAAKIKRGDNELGCRNLETWVIFPWTNLKTS